MTEARGDLVVVACAVSSGIHAALAPQHFEDSMPSGLGFVVSAAVLAGLAAGLARRPSGRLLDATIVVFGGLIGAYVLATTTGIPVLHPQPEPVDGLAITTKAVEVFGLLASLGLKGTLSRQRRPLPLTLITLIALFGALAALAVSSGHTHAHDESHATAEVRPGRTASLTKHGHC